MSTSLGSPRVWPQHDGVAGLDRLDRGDEGRPVSALQRAEHRRVAGGQRDLEVVHGLHDGLLRLGAEGRGALTDQGPVGDARCSASEQAADLLGVRLVMAPEDRGDAGRVCGQRRDALVVQLPGGVLDALGEAEQDRVLGGRALRRGGGGRGLGRRRARRGRSGGVGLGRRPAGGHRGEGGAGGGGQASQGDATGEGPPLGMLGALHLDAFVVHAADLLDWLPAVAVARRCPSLPGDGRAGQL